MFTARYGLIPYVKQITFGLEKFNKASWLFSIDSTELVNSAHTRSHNYSACLRMRFISGFFFSHVYVSCAFTSANHPFYDAYSDSKYRFAVKENRVTFRINFYCYQILHSSNYFSTYSPPLLRYLS